MPVVADVVKRQVGIGLDCIGDGEYWSALDIKWFDQQMTGLSTRLLKPGEVGSMRESTRERDVFRTLYADMDRVGTIACIPGERPRPPMRERRYREVQMELAHANRAANADFRADPQGRSARITLGDRMPKTVKLLPGSASYGRW